MANDDVDLKDDSTEEDAKDAGLDESNGVDSDAGSSPLLVLASRLHTGQKVLHVVSQESTQKAWNSVQVSRRYNSATKHYIHEEINIFLQMQQVTCILYINDNILAHNHSKNTHGVFPMLIARRQAQIL